MQPELYVSKPFKALEFRYTTVGVKALMDFVLPAKLNIIEKTGINNEMSIKLIFNDHTLLLPIKQGDYVVLNTIRTRFYYVISKEDFELNYEKLVTMEKTK